MSQQAVDDRTFRSAVLDPHVRRIRVSIYGRGVYIDAQDLRSALNERGAEVSEAALDAHVRALGGQRLSRSARGWLTRLLGRRDPRPAYYLPEQAYQQLRQRHPPP